MSDESEEQNLQLPTVGTKVVDHRKGEGQRTGNVVETEVCYYPGDPIRYEFVVEYGFHQTRYSYKEKVGWENVGYIDSEMVIHIDR